MVWWIGALTAGAAAWRFFSADQSGWAGFAFVVALIGVWAAGVSMKFLNDEEQQMPKLVRYTNMAAVGVGVSVFVASLVIV